MCSLIYDDSTKLEREARYASIRLMRRWTEIKLCSPEYNLNRRLSGLSDIEASR